MKAAFLAGLALFWLGSAEAESLRPDQTAFRALYKELVETNTTLSEGDCSLAASRMAAHLRQAGFPESAIKLWIPEGKPRFGSLVATLPGTEPALKPILLLAHIDVVEAKREDWQRDPFALIEENGFFYGRGTSDDKAMAAIFTDLLVRLKQDGFKPRRTLRLALTCGEETSANYDGVADLLASDKSLLDAEFGLNEGAVGRLDEADKRVALEIEAGEKVYQDFQLETVNPGGHSARPRKDNAIYQLTAALDRLAAFDFPAALSPVTQSYFAAMAKATPGPAGADLAELGAGKADPAVIARIAEDPSWNSMLRTTCVATMIEGGHAPNALPQQAKANLNCRILPGVPLAEVEQTLNSLIADPGVRLSRRGEVSPTSPAPPLSEKILAPVRKVSAKMWPGVPLVPTLSTGATDARFLNAAGIPVYGLSGIFRDPDGSGVHGLNERIRVTSLYEGRDFLTEVVKLYATE